MPMDKHTKETIFGAAALFFGAAVATWTFKHTHQTGEDSQICKAWKEGCWKAEDLLIKIEQLINK